ncbi:MAG: hypothetical protein WDW38_006242 [Sanguina aurantia]
MPHIRAAASQASRCVAAASAPVDFASMQFDMPDIDGDMTSIQVEMGAVFNDAGRATTFKNPGAVLQAVETGVALVDRCHMGRLRITGPGRVAFAQQQFTSDVAAVKAGHGFETLLLNPDGSMLDLVTVIVGQSHLMVMVSAETKDQVAERFARYVLPGDGVQGCIPMGDEEWHDARVVNGRPAPGAELAPGYSPWEAGLQHLVSMDKGHFIGRDALESTLNGLSSSGAGSSSSSSSKPSVSRQLRGLSFTVPVSVGAPITSALTVVGSVTSVGQDMEGRWVGLGYVRCRTAAGEELQLDGMSVAVAGYPASIRPIPFITHSTTSVLGNGNSSVVQSATSVSSADAGAGSSSAEAGSNTGERQLNPWKLVVDREIGGVVPRVARVIDVAAIQAHARSEPGASE